MLIAQYVPKRAGKAGGVVNWGSETESEAREKAGLGWAGQDHIS